MSFQCKMTWLCRCSQTYTIMPSNLPSGMHDSSGISGTLWLLTYKIINVSFGRRSILNLQCPKCKFTLTWAEQAPFDVLDLQLCRSAHEPIKSISKSKRDHCLCMPSCSCFSIGCCRQCYQVDAHYPHLPDRPVCTGSMSQLSAWLADLQSCPYHPIHPSVGIGKLPLCYLSFWMLHDSCRLKQPARSPGIRTSTLIQCLQAQAC